MIFFVDIKFEYFLDSEKVIRRLEAKSRRVLARVGGLGRSIMKRSMRPGGRKSKRSRPGEPPRYHTKLLRDRIFFVVDPVRTELLVGPQYLPGPHSRVSIQGAETIPELLNIGGQSTHKSIGGTVTKTTIKPRPFVDPVRPPMDKLRDELIERESL